MPLQSHEVSQLYAIFTALPTGVLLLDGEGLITRANPAALALLGEPLEGLSWRQIIARCFEPREDDGHEISLRDGRRVQLSTQPLPDQPGQLVFITDLTETRQLQDRVNHMKRLSALGNMAASLAHQIRTPLSAAMLYAANLANRTLKPESRSQFQQKLMARLQDLEKQINDILLFARNGDNQVVAPSRCRACWRKCRRGPKPSASSRAAPCIWRPLSPISVCLPTAVPWRGPSTTSSPMPGRPAPIRSW
jgi:two-component system sensor histidine kinase FlrB